MKRHRTGASRAAGPKGLGGMREWLTAGALIFGIVPVSVQAQDTMGSFRSGRFSQPRPSAVAAATHTYPYPTNPYAVSPSTSGTLYLYGNSYAPGSSSMDSGPGGAVAGYGS